jgi:hypothetical protein
MGDRTAAAVVAALNPPDLSQSLTGTGASDEARASAGMLDA